MTTEHLSKLRSPRPRMVRLFAISRVTLASALAASLLAAVVTAQDVTTDIGTLDKEAAEKVFPSKPPYSPYAGRNFPTRPYFGDTHTHTSYSMDAGAFGARLGPRTLIVSLRARRSSLPAGSVPSFRDPWISWW